MGIASRRISPPLGGSGELHCGELHSSELHNGELPVVGLAGQQLAVTIERVVRERIGGKIQGLKVEVRREGVFLLGVCPTFYVKQLAQHAAMRVAGPMAITNEIKVI